MKQLRHVADIDTFMHSKTGALGDFPPPGYKHEMNIVLMKADNIYIFI